MQQAREPARSAKREQLPQGDYKRLSAGQSLKQIAKAGWTIGECASWPVKADRVQPVGQQQRLAVLRSDQGGDAGQALQIEPVLRPTPRGAGDEQDPWPMIPSPQWASVGDGQVRSLELDQAEGRRAQMRAAPDQARAWASASGRTI